MASDPSSTASTTTWPYTTGDDHFTHDGARSTVVSDVANPGLPFPYSVVIWPIALVLCLIIGLCLLRLISRKWARRRRQRRHLQGETGPAAKPPEPEKEKSPIKIANPLSCRDSCAICCDPYMGNQDDITIGYVRPCGHYFHHSCAWRWISVRETCPLCRNPVDLKKAELTGMTLQELEQLLGVPNGTLRRDKGKKPENSLTEETTGRIKTISLTIDLPVVLPTDEVTSLPIGQSPVIVPSEDTPPTMASL